MDVWLNRLLANIVTSPTFFFVVQYASNFLIVTREHKRRIFLKRKYCQSYAEEVDLLRTPTGLF